MGKQPRSVGELFEAAGWTDLAGIVAKGKIAPFVQQTLMQGESDVHTGLGRQKELLAISRGGRQSSASISIVVI
jgi:hypothetical protein